MQATPSSLSPPAANLPIHNRCLPCLGPSRSTVANRDFQHYVKDVIYFTKVVIPGAIAPCRDSRTVQLGQAIPPESAEILREHGVADSGASDQSRLPDTTTWPGLSVMGHSMGGLMAFYAALEDPTLFRGVRVRSSSSVAHLSWSHMFARGVFGSSSLPLTSQLSGKEKDNIHHRGYELGREIYTATRNHW